MTLGYNDEKPSLEHYGVKGMKWGKRKKYTTQEIHDARARQRSRFANLEAQVHKTNLSTGKAQEANAKKLVKLHNDLETNKDAAVAARMTKGEKAANLILAGPIGALAIAANNRQVRKLEEIQKK